jgi:hypothetical protein
VGELMKQMHVSFTVQVGEGDTAMRVEEMVREWLGNQGDVGIRVAVTDLQVTEEIDIVSAYPNTVRKARMTKMLLNSIYGKSGLKVEVELNPVISIKGMKYVNATLQGNSIVDFDITTEAAHELRAKLDIALKAAQSHGMD